MIQCQRTPVVTLWGPVPSPCREGGGRVLPIVCLFLSYPVVSLRPRGSLPDRAAGRKSPSKKSGELPPGDRSATPEARIFPEAPGRRRLAENGSLAQWDRRGPVRHPVAPIPYCTGFFDKITAETAGRKQDSRGGAWRERRECGREKRKDWRTLLFFRPLLAPSGPPPDDQDPLFSSGRE